MTFTYATPALLFPAVSLLFLSYTNRFITYANLIRDLHARWEKDKCCLLEEQIKNLKQRVRLIIVMQLFGALSLFLSSACMLVFFGGKVVLAEIVFAGALFFMCASLLVLLVEIFISARALNLQLQDMEDRNGTP